jgi:hypothetical protein
MFEDAPQIDQQTLASIREICSDLSMSLLTDEEIRQDAPTEIIYKPTGSGGFADEKIRPEWEHEFENPRLDEELDAMEAARSQAPKRPGETRDIGILSPGSIRTHRRFMWNLQRACIRIKGCPYGKDQGVLRKVIRSLGENNSYFFMRDYAKSGMTIPHEVINAVLSGFYSRRPDLAKLGSSFYCKGRLWLKNSDSVYEAHKPKTGAPLGLFVEGYTLLQYAIHELNCGAMAAPAGKYQFSATNDDMVVGARDEDSITHYMEVDAATNSLLGMAFKETKSGTTCDRFVYCEEYWIEDRIIEKESLTAVGILAGKLACNIVQAKDYVFSSLLNTGWISPLVRQAVRLVQEEFPFEFCEEEKAAPYIFGGWWPQYKDGLDYSWEWFNGSSKQEMMYWSTQAKIGKQVTYKSTPTLALGRQMGARLLEPSHENLNIVDAIPLFGTQRTLKRHYRRPAKGQDSVVNDYRLLWKLRHARWLKYTSGREETPSVSSKWLLRHPSSIIRPGMSGLRLTADVEVIHHPRMGMPAGDLHGKLCALSELGVVHYPKTRGVRPTHMKMYRDGILPSLRMPLIPVPRETGISRAALNVHYKGIVDLFERYQKGVITMYDGDEPLDVTRYWAAAPSVSLRSAYRLKDMTKSYIPHPEQFQIEWYGRMYTQMRSEDPPIPDVDEPAPILSFDIDQFIDDMVRNISLFASSRGLANIEVLSMRERIDRAALIDLVSRERFAASGVLELIAQASEQSGELATTLGDAPSDGESEVYDPWAELGV